MASYSIKDLEELSGIKAHTIRIWEKRYGIVVPARTDTNIRLYSDNDLKKLLNISILNRYGLKISHLARMDEEELKDKVIHISRESTDTGLQIENLIISMLELDEWKFDKILNDTIIKLGFEDTLVRLMHPFFEKIGLLWQTGSINPAQEHFVSNLLRQKLIVAIDGQAPVQRDNPVNFILFLHESEFHELGLLFYSYLLKKNGIKVIYLGQAVPFDDLEKITKIQKAEYFLTSFTTGITEGNLVKYLQNLSSSFPNHRILYTGLQTAKINGSLPQNLVKIESVTHFRQYIGSIR
ncbi:MAG: MerR family transcriptional regulator [Marinilabiliales bacterium]|nr:MAG: MerR family transcriptional regulator [Marinilabiliales bacterium]